MAPHSPGEAATRAATVPYCFHMQSDIYVYIFVYVYIYIYIYIYIIYIISGLMEYISQKVAAYGQFVLVLYIKDMFLVFCISFAITVYT